MGRDMVAVSTKSWGFPPANMSLHSPDMNILCDCSTVLLVKLSSPCLLQSFGYPTVIKAALFWLKYRKDGGFM